MNEKEWILLPGLRHTFDKFEVVAKDYLSKDVKCHDRPILLIGDSGVGKSLFTEVAKQMFIQDGNSPELIVRVNCASFTRELAESEIFGHLKGSFTGATKDKAGIVKTAKNGLLILDEIGELPEDIQAKLLIFIEEGSYRPVGAVENIYASLKIIGTTNKSQDFFREDFWYRFFPIFIPPLYERRLDVLYFISYKYPEVFKRLTARHALPLLAYHWPGNIREVERVVSLMMLEDSLAFRNSDRYCAGEEVLWRQLFFPADSRQTSLSVSSLNKFVVELIKYNFNVGKLCKIISKYGISLNQAVNVIDMLCEAMFNNAEELLNGLSGIEIDENLTSESLELINREVENKPKYKSVKEMTSTSMKIDELFHYDADRQDEFYRKLLSKQDFEGMGRLYNNVYLSKSLPSLERVGSCFKSLCKLFLKNPQLNGEVFDSTEMYISDSDWNDPHERKLFEKFDKIGLVKKSLEFLCKHKINMPFPINFFLSWKTYVNLIIVRNREAFEKLPSDGKADASKINNFELNERELRKKYYAYLLGKYKTKKEAAEHAGIEHSTFCKRFDLLNLP